MRVYDKDLVQLDMPRAKGSVGPYDQCAHCVSSLDILPHVLRRRLVKPDCISYSDEDDYRVLWLGME